MQELLFLKPAGAGKWIAMFSLAEILSRQRGRKNKKKSMGNKQKIVWEMH